jgi:hypothetical protein
MSVAGERRQRQGSLRLFSDWSAMGAGYAVTAGQDMIISVYRLDPPQEEPAYSLIGHDHNVCALHTASDGTIISGSWDRYVTSRLAEGVVRRCLIRAPQYRKGLEGFQADV